MLNVFGYVSGNVSLITAAVYHLYARSLTAAAHSTPIHSFTHSLTHEKYSPLIRYIMNPWCNGSSVFEFLFLVYPFEMYNVSQMYSTLSCSLFFQWIFSYFHFFRSCNFFVPLCNLPEHVCFAIQFQNSFKKFISLHSDEK